MSRETILKVIGALAEDIRGDWSNCVDDRIDQMIDLCRRLGEINWISELDNNRCDICDDGRWMRDWSGPYGGEVTKKELEGLGLSEHIFNYPKNMISDYDD